MRVEQGFPWHPVVTGLVDQAIASVVAASHAQAVLSPPFWFLVRVVLVASAALLCPCSLCTVLSLVPCGVAPVCCVFVMLLTLFVGTLGCPFRAPTPAPPACPPYQGFTSPYDADGSVRGWLVTALLPPPWRAPPGPRGVAPALVEYVGTL